MGLEYYESTDYKWSHSDACIRGFAVEAIIACPHCQGRLAVTSDMAGQTFACPACGGQFIAPQVGPPIVQPAEAGFPLNAQRKTPSPGNYKSSRRSGKTEIQARCKACGHVWHYLPGERMSEFGQSIGNVGHEMQKFGCSVMTCGCLSPFMSTRPKASITSRCPKCNSTAIDRQKVVH
jgi:predicted Zn-ribbon and HTH transcriptional regulator